MSYASRITNYPPWRTIRARYHSACRACGAQICQGERVAWHPDYSVVVCSTCIANGWTPPPEDSPPTYQRVRIVREEHDPPALMLARMVRFVRSPR